MITATVIIENSEKRSRASAFLVRSELATARTATLGFFHGVCSSSYYPHKTIEYGDYCNGYTLSLSNQPAPAVSCASDK